MEPEEIANQISSAIESSAENTNAQIDIEKQRLDLEKQRIKSEERIAERMAERDENVAEIQHDANYYRSMLDELFGRIDSYFNSGISNSPPQTINVDASDSEIPDAAQEDKPENSEPELDEGIESIGDEESEEPEQSAPVENPPEEKNGNRGFRRKRGRR